MVQQEDQFKVAPIISQEKKKLFLEEIFCTVFGITKQMRQSVIISIIQSIVLCSILIIIPLVSNDVRIALIIPSVGNVIVCFIFDLFRKAENQKNSEKILKLIIFGIYNALWANHLFVLRQHHGKQQGLIVVSCISIVTSIGSISMGSLKQFCGYSVENSILAWNSTAYMRFFIVFPTLLIEIIYYNVVENVLVNEQYISVIRFISSLIFITWVFGWISSLRNTINFILNKLNMLGLGQQSKNGFNHLIFSIVLNMGGIAIFQAIFYTSNRYSLLPLIIGATVSSIIIFIKDACIYQNRVEKSFVRSVLMILVEIAICVLLCLIYQLSKDKINPNIFLIIDVSLYFLFAFLKEIHQGWSRFGCNINLSCFKYSHLLLIQRILLRTFSGLSILFILTNHMDSIVMSLINTYRSHVISYMIIPFISYRSFKRSISQTKSFSLHISILLCLILINTGYLVEGCLILLVMPPFPHNPYLTFLSIFTIPPKARHKNQTCYQLLYALINFFTISLHLLTLGIFQLTMIFGLPIYFPIIGNETEGYQVKSAQNSLYQKIIQNLDESLFRNYESGLYLFRVQKYLILMEIKETNYGFGQIIDYKGLQVQEVTSCHSKEGQTIDKLVEQTWGVNKKCLNLDPFYIAISPFQKQSIVTAIQNDIQLTGVIQSKQFVVLFKETALKAIIRQYSKIFLTDNQKKQGEIMMSQISAFYKKQAAQKIFPYQFAKSNNIAASYSSQNGKVKLPPIKANKKQVHNDFLDLLEGSQQHFQKTGTLLNDKQGSIISENKKQFKMDQLNMSIILTLYYYSVGKLDYVNVQKLYKIIKKDSQAISQIQFDNYLNILSPALSCAFKMSIDKYINGQFTVTNQDFQEYQTTSFLGTTDSPEFQRAIAEDKPDIWTIHFVKKSLVIKRMAKIQTSMYVFKVDNVIARSVWNNLRFQLVYATNDNDQRYSIQTHPSLLRNLWVEACEQPFGYPGFHRGAWLNK